MNFDSKKSKQQVSTRRPHERLFGLLSKLVKFLFDRSKYLLFDNIGTDDGEEGVNVRLASLKITNRAMNDKISMLNCDLLESFGVLPFSKGPREKRAPIFFFFTSKPKSKELKMRAVVRRKVCWKSFLSRRGGKPHDGADDCSACWCS